MRSRRVATSNDNLHSFMKPIWKPLIWATVVVARRQEASAEVEDEMPLLTLLLLTLERAERVEMWG